ncbi:tetratricopeptide repeat protein [Fibrella aquatilis]|uniref:Tetratricopeptide repeat protein n=1 Tax=Fibrella aquatilis TaxID=2817059 RepID=A0A939G5K7_9BACT|nr:tetratricopeptide repeat protein [Fibrella aquatilis]MBO0930632.1 tetratricopeptide repeat protein [Fibrella aquatilis]
MTADEWYAKGFEAYENGHSKEAINAYGQAIALRPDHVNAHNAIGVIYYEQGHYKEAIEAYQTAINYQANLSFALHNLGAVYIMQGQYEKAIEAFKTAIHYQPDYANAHKSLGIAYKNQGHYEKAIEAYQTAIEYHPDYADAYYSLGNVYKDQEHHKEAVEAYQAAIHCQPNYSSAHTNLGTVYIKQGQYERAIEAFKTAIHYQPDNHTAYLNLGLEYYRQERYEEAITFYKTAVRHQDSCAEAHNNLGLVYAEQNRYEEAIESYKTAIHHQPNFSAIHINLGIAHKEQGNYLEAQYHFNRALFMAEDPRQRQISEFFSTVVPFFREYADAPYVLKALFARFPYVDNLESYKKAILQTERQCAAVDTLLGYYASLTDEQGEDYGYALALTSYFMGHTAEAFRLYDDVLDKEFSLSLMGQFYYLCAWADFLEPKLDAALLDALTKKVEPYVISFDRDIQPVSELYYAGLIYYWAWQQVNEPTYLQAADTIFRKADYYVPAQYMRLLTLDALNDAEGKQRQLEKIQRSRLRVYEDGFKQQTIDFAQPLLPQLMHYAHFREIQAAIELATGNGAPVPPFYEAWRIDLTKTQREKAAEYQRQKASATALGAIQDNARQQESAFSTQSQDERTQRLTNDESIAEALHRLTHPAPHDTHLLEERLARFINSWQLTIPKQARLDKACVYADFVKYFFCEKHYDLPTMLRLLHYVYHHAAEEAQKSGVFSKTKEQAIQSGVSSGVGEVATVAGFVTGFTLPALLVNLLTKPFSDKMGSKCEEWLSKDKTHLTGIGHYRDFCEHYHENLGDYLGTLEHDDLFDEDVIRYWNEWHAHQVRLLHDDLPTKADEVR